MSEADTGDCGVCLNGFEGNTEWITTKVYRAGKAHVCCECRQPIPKGTQYEYAAGKFEGDFRHFHTCLVCAEIADTFYCEGRTYGGILWEDMEEIAFPELTTGCLARLKTADAKAYLAERWKAWKFRVDLDRGVITQENA